MPSTTIATDQWRNAPRPARACGHVHDTTSRYDHRGKRLDFLLVCPVCGTETVIETLDYEPHFEPLGASVHALPPRRDPQPVRRAA
jgi:hypothetical protein